MSKSLKVVFFDMGNTLLHFHHGKSDKEKDAVGLKYLTDFLKQYSDKITYHEVKNDFFKKWNEIMPLRKLYNTEYPIETYLNNLMKKYGVKLELDLCKEAMNIFYTEYRNYVRTEKNICQTLEIIRSKGYRIGVISNSCLYDEVMINCFKKVGIDKLIDCFTFSYYLKVSKPKREIFEIALKRMNIDPDQAIMIGDNLISDVEISKQLGLISVWFNNKRCPNNSNIIPDLEISQLFQINDYI